ncbi:hypothetical protein [Chitinophaga filiformis]|uniref:Dolichyl-phosphate-mannose-protein mannosyltransferase n=1 Tax=Chitinophaga filiformis TaxID=104663 RepID=A0A1G7UPU7_CHIFI|nr:hypothetical protein [Chitinophaga filiformis]SDG49139.1 hypothetical protein SAMN04488121_104451 [Chitinophaga filiformis]
MEPEVQSKSNPDRIYAYAAIVIAFVQFIIFKYLYPFPNFLPDSYNYIRSALRNMNANLWPVGYSKLISFVGFFNHSDTLLIFVQYFMYIVAALYFFFTFLSIIQCSKWVKIGIFIFLFLNPAFIFISNYISSDIFFTSLSLIWISQLFRIIKTPSTTLLTAHIFILLFAFAVRYNALFYPVISIIVILKTSIPKGSKVFTIITIFLTLVTFAMYTSNENKRIFGTRQFSAFGGWQLASNALTAYEHVENRKQAPEKFAALQAEVNKYLDSVKATANEDAEPKTHYAFYLWEEKAPLQRYSRIVTPTGSKRMATVAPLYKDYGTYLISQHPGAFFNHYLLPNAKQYFLPWPEFLSIYNQGLTTVKSEAVQWFGYKNNNVSTRVAKRTNHLFDYYPILIVCITLLFLGGSILYFTKKWYLFTTTQFRSALLITLLFWITNLFFSVFASPIVLRYQLFNMALAFTFALPLVDFFLRAETPPADISTPPEDAEPDPEKTALQPL